MESFVSAFKISKTHLNMIKNSLTNKEYGKNNLE